MKKTEPKTNKLNFFGSILTAFLLMIGTASFAQERENVRDSEVDEFNQYDENSDQQLDQKEFSNWLYESGAYDKLDRDRSGAIDQNEFSEAILIIYGLDRDTPLNNAQSQNAQTQQNQEKNTQDTTMGTNGTMEPGTFQDWDKDRSGTIDQAEYDEAILIIYGVSPVNTNDPNQGTQNTETDMNNTNNNNSTESENSNSTGTEMNTEAEVEPDTNNVIEPELKETETDTEIETEVGTEK